ncbi:MAG: CocE/NonD family hydrolase [Gemmatimonadales bacterium]|nr:CocE/NonD family hydrolase [Gemmatimonadales bacterium]
MAFVRRFRGLAAGLVLLVVGAPTGAGADPPGPHRVIREFGVRMRTSDGVALVADVYRPDTAGRSPAILVRTPYTRTGGAQFDAGTYWASHGYAYVVQDVRGRGDSEGEFEPLVHEGRDGFEAQGWVASQPWSNGRVGTWGGSYLGWTQVLSAPLNHPALGALIPMVTPSDPGGFWPMRRGGIVLGMLEWALVTEGRTVRDVPGDHPDLVAAYRSLPLRSIDERIGMPSRVWRDYLAHLDDSAYWAPRSYQHRLPEARAPMFHVTGWYDGTLGGSLENFATMRARAAPAVRDGHYLLVGPWRHWVDTDSRSRTLGGIDLGAASQVDTYRQYRLWFDHQLRGQANEVGSWPRVRVFALGANRWIGAAEWPVPGTRFVPYYLHGARAGVPAAGRLATELPPGTGGTDRYEYDPSDPTPFLWSRNLDSGGPDDYRSVEARRDVLVYTMPSPPRPLTVCGPIRATLQAATSARDTDWVARLTLVRPDGYSQRLTEGWVRARARDGEFRRSPLPPNVAVEYQIDLWGTCVVVRPGERLRLAVMSAAFPLLARNLNTGGDLGAETEGVVARQAIHHEPGRLSYLTLPIIDRPNWIPKP